MLLSRLVQLDFLWRRLLQSRNVLTTLRSRLSNDSKLLVRLLILLLAQCHVDLLKIIIRVAVLVIIRIFRFLPNNSAIVDVRIAEPVLGNLAEIFCTIVLPVSSPLLYLDTRELFRG